MKGYVYYLGRSTYLLALLADGARWPDPSPRKTT